MKNLAFILIALTVSSCKNADDQHLKKVSAPAKDTFYVRDTVYVSRENVDWQKDFGLSHEPKKDSIWGKPVAFYLDDKECNATAFDFYYGYMHPTDNGTTTELMKLACTNNKKLRPFYRWCLDKTIQVSDGALTELTGVPARQYAEKYPDEFFQYIDSDGDIKKYKEWTDAIQYSGYFDRPDYDNREKQKLELILRMTKNLQSKTNENISRVKTFARDCAVQ